MYRGTVNRSSFGVRGKLRLNDTRVFLHRMIENFSNSVAVWIHAVYFRKYAELYKCTCSKRIQISIYVISNVRVVLFK